MVKPRRQYLERCGWLFVFLVLSGCNATDFAEWIDSDRDGLTDAVERRLGTDPFDGDTDGDTIGDGEEIEANTSPLAADSDRDGISDGQDPTVGAPSRESGSISSGNDVEPNDSFAQAVPAAGVGFVPRVFEGRIDRPDDLDVFDLGLLPTGDQIDVDLVGVDSTLRPTLGLFDASERLVDIRAYPYVETGLDVPGMINQKIRRTRQRHWLVVTHGINDTSLGDYRVEVALSPSQTVSAQVQTVFLDFRGGTLAPPILGASEVAPFSAERIVPAYAGTDDRLASAILFTIQRDFAGLAVVVRSSMDQAPPVDVPYTTILFGSGSSDVLAGAVGIDPYNEDRCDDGVVFTESFSPVTFGFTPDLERLALAMGQAASHEIGHLLGLRHVDDEAGLMNEEPLSSSLFQDLDFREAPLGATAFPIGRQNAPQLLLDTVGPR